MDASFCDPSSPDAKTVDGPFDYSASCSYTPVYSYGPCVQTNPGQAPGTRSGTLLTCTRSDGTDVTSRNQGELCAPTTVQSCTATVYAAVYAVTNACVVSGVGATSGTTTNPISGCTAPGGTAMPLSNCSNLPQSRTTACSVTYQGTYTYGSCAGGTQTGPISKCTATDSNGISTTVANANCPATSTQNCTVQARCAALQQYKIPSGYTGNVLIASYQANRTAADMQTVCESYAVARGGTGSCWINNAGGTTEVYWETSTTLQDKPSSSWLYAAICTPK